MRKVAVSLHQCDIAFDQFCTQSLVSQLSVQLWADNALQLEIFSRAAQLTHDFVQHGLGRAATLGFGIGHDLVEIKFLLDTGFMQ